MSNSLIKYFFKLTRSKRLKLLDELEQSQWYCLERIKQIQWQKIIKLLKHIYINVPYYKQIFNNLDLNPSDFDSLENFKRLPLLGKEEIIKNFLNLIALNYKKNDLIPNSTGGSTGVNLKFFSDRKSSDYFNAIILRNNSWAGCNIGNRQALLWGSHYDISKAKNLYKKYKDAFIHRKLLLSSYDMTEKSMLEYRDQINKHRPKLITGYASPLYLFSKFLVEKKLDIFTPKGIISSAETLYDHQRKTIESVFGCKVFNRYGCREVGCIAHECEEQKGLHINSEHIFIEIINESGNPCMPGELGKVVVTDLDNYAFPFIRYDIGDIGVLKDKECPCGRGLPLLQKIEGRVFDIIVGTNGNRLSGTFWTILLREFVKGVSQFQVIQEEFGELILKLVIEDSFTKKEKQKLLNRIYKNCGENMKVKIQCVDEIPLTNSGKHKYIISKVSPFVV